MRSFMVTSRRAENRISLTACGSAASTETPKANNKVAKNQVCGFMAHSFQNAKQSQPNPQRDCWVTGERGSRIDCIIPRQHRAIAEYPVSVAVEFCVAR